MADTAKDGLIDYPDRADSGPSSRFTASAAHGPGAFSAIWPPIRFATLTARSAWHSRKQATIDDRR